MHVIDVQNVCEALPAGLRYLQEHGHWEESRAGRVLVAPVPVTTVYRGPTCRVLFSAIRDANPFFHMAEALWMLAGRSDAKFLNNFVWDFGARFAESASGRPNSEDGHIHGAYGYRWRDGFGFDQLDFVVEKLRNNPHDRQCVIQMWDCREGDAGNGGISGGEYGFEDLRGKFKDRPCLAGDTVIWSPEGDATISELARRFSGGVRHWPVYGVDEETKELKITWATAVWKSGKKQTTIITFDDGSSLRATADHTFYVYPKRRQQRGSGKPGAMDTAPCRVDQLKVGDRVLATRRFHGRKGHELVKRCLGKNTAFSNMQAPHKSYYRLVYGEIPEGTELHHINEKKLDNRLCNLEPLDPGEHSRLHRLGDKNPMRRMTREQHAARACKQSISIKKSWAALNPEQRSARATGRSLSDNHVIVSIETGPMEDVYDFTVPKMHTALVGTGVVTHNCNTQAYLRVRSEHLHAPLLDITVCCRSNDMVWGAYGANAVHFSVLQEYLAARIGVGIGVYYQVSNNFHCYETELKRLRERADKLGHDATESLSETLTDNRYPQAAPIPMINDSTSFEHEFLSLLYAYENDTLSGDTVANLRNTFLGETVRPMFTAHRQFKQKHGHAAIDTAGRIEAPDWRAASVEWLKRKWKNQ